MENYNVFINKYKSVDEIKVALDKGELNKPYVAMIEGVSGNIIDFNTVEATDWSKDYFQFEVTNFNSGNQKFALSHRVGGINNPHQLFYKIDDGEWFGEDTTTWTTDFSSAVSIGSIIRVKSSGWNMDQYDEPAGLAQGEYFRITGNANVKGNLLSLCLGDNFIGGLIPSGQNFTGLFMSCVGIRSARNLYLPPAVALNKWGYALLFQGSGFLTEAPKLEATAVGYQAYLGMFIDCPYLEIAPELPATSLGEMAYVNMFRNCERLLEAPELPAISLGTSCYQYMFNGCHNLSYVKCLIQSGMENCQGWLTDVATEGTFVKKAGATWPTGASGIPEGWTVIEE